MVYFLIHHLTEMRRELFKYYRTKLNYLWVMSISCNRCLKSKTLIHYFNKFAYGVTGAHLQSCKLACLEFVIWSGNHLSCPIEVQSHPKAFLSRSQQVNLVYHFSITLISYVCLIDSTCHKIRQRHQHECSYQGRKLTLFRQ